MKTTPKLLSALLLSLAASGQALASSCVDTEFVFKVELAVDIATMDACFEKGGKTCQDAFAYVIAKAETIKNLADRYRLCVVELYLANPEGVKQVTKLIEEDTEKTNRMMEMAKKTKGKF